MRCRHDKFGYCEDCEWASRGLRNLHSDFIVWPERIGQLAAAANSLGALPHDHSPWVATETASAALSEAAEEEAG